MFISCLGQSLAGPVSLSGTSYTQDFQSMTASDLTPATISTTTMLEVSGQPGGGASVTGWYIYQQASGTPRWGRSNGASSTGSFFGMYDAASTPGRALGSQSSSSLVGFLGVVLQNLTGSTITSLNVSYDAVINRNPSTTVNPYPMSYRVSSTNVATSSSTGAGTFNDAAGTWITGTGFTTPSSGTGSPATTQAAITPLFRIGGAAITQTLSGLNWGANEYLYVRWKETDDSGSDATAGVDNFSVTVPFVAAAPTVTTGTATSITASGATLGGNITVSGGSNATVSGVEYSTTNGFINGAGTQANTTGSFGTGTFTQAVTGLATGTIYYFKAFATNTTGMGYGTQGTFTTNGAAPPSLNAAANATVDAPFTVTFTEDATWRTAIIGVTVGGTTLSASAYTVGAGQIVLTPATSALLQSSGTKTIVVQATGYSGATVSQAILAGTATKLGVTTQPTAPATNGAILAAQPVISIQDQYGNTTASTATVTAAVDAGIWTLGGTANIAAVVGHASFTGLTATSASAVTGATISFTSTGLTGITSSSFNIPAPPYGFLSVSFTENFDSMGTSGTTPPQGWSNISVAGGNTAWTNHPIPASGTPSAATNTTVNNTLIATTSFATDSSTQAFNFAESGSATNRSLGTLPTGNAGNILQLRLQNDTGSPLTAINLSYDTRRFSTGSGAETAPGYGFFYSTDGGTTWTESSVLRPTISTVPGNVGTSPFGSALITFASIPNGSEIRLRWIDDNSSTSSPDQAIGLDNLTVSAVYAPTVTTGTTGSITTSGAAISGNNVSADGGAAITERGVVYSTSTNPTIAGPKTVVAGTTGSFDANISGLSAASLYYVRAYATNAISTSYGTEISFTSATPSGVITTGGSVTARSTIYGTASASDSFTVSGTGLTGDLAVAAPSGFEVSLDAGSGYSTSIPITASGTLADTTVHVRLAATTVPGSFSGNIVISGGDAASQNVAIPASTVSVKPLTLTSAAVPSKSYNGNTNATITGTLAGVNGTDVVGFIGTGTFASANIGTGIAVTAAVTLTGADAGKYSITQPNGLTGDITLGTQTITFAALPAKATSDVPFALTATASSGLAVSYVSFNPAVATISGSTVTIIGAGTTTITASQAGNTNYSAATPVDQLLTVTAGPSVLTAGDIAMIALQTDDADQFGFVTLADLNPGTQIAFTDNAWTGTTFASGENIIVWQVPSGGLAKGTFVTFINGAGFSTGNTVSGSYSGASTSGDQVIAYQGTTASPTFIYALTSNTWITTGTPTTNNSYLPTGLINGTSARDFTAELDNQYYTPVTNTGSKASLLAAIGSTANWTRSDTRFGSLPAWTFTVGTPTISTTGTLSALSTTYGTASGNATFSVAGDFMNAGITVTSPAGFEVSTSAGNGFASSIVVGAGGTISSTPVYVRLTATAGVAGSPYSGNIVLTSTGATSVNVATAASTVSAAALAPGAITISETGGVYSATSPNVSGFTVSYSGRSPTNYGPSATVPSAAGLYTATATSSDPNFSGSNSADYFIVGVIAANDNVTRQANSGGFKIPIATLLGNDSQVDAGGALVQTGLSVNGVNSGTGNSVSVSGAFVFFTPADPSASESLTFTYTLGNGASTATGTVTVATVAATAFSLDLVRVVTPATFAGGETSMTVEFAAVPGQTYNIEYSTNLSSWVARGAVATGQTGTFNVTFTAAGDVAAAWNSSMFFRATR